jgi:hypothetical protein
LVGGLLECSNWKLLADWSTNRFDLHPKKEKANMKNGSPKDVAVSIIHCMNDAWKTIIVLLASTLLFSCATIVGKSLLSQLTVGYYDFN